MSFLKSRIEDRRSRIDDRDPTALGPTTFFPFSILDLPLSSFCPSSILHSRLSFMPLRGLLIRIGQAQDRCFIEVFANDLHADRQTVCVESAWERKHPQNP